MYLQSLLLKNKTHLGIEAMGMSVPYSSSHLSTDVNNNISEGKKQDIQNSTKALFHLLKRGIR